MWEPRRLTNLWNSTACYRDSFTSFFFTLDNMRRQTCPYRRFVIYNLLIYGLFNDAISSPAEFGKSELPWHCDKYTSLLNWQHIFKGDITPCSPLRVSRRFRGICHLRLHGRIISQVRNQHEALHAELIKPWRWRRYVLPKRRLNFNGFHCVMSQKT
jgi:hypothetical protein